MGTYHIFKFVQGASTLVDLQDQVNFFLNSWSPDLFTTEGWAHDDLEISIHGTSQTNLADNVVAFMRLLTAAYDNFKRLGRGQAYTPIFLQFQLQGGATTLQAEVFVDDWSKLAQQKIQNILDKPVTANRIEHFTWTLTRRPYFEETAAVPIVTNQPLSNNGGLYTITGLRGDLPAPLKITARANTTNIDRVIAGLKADGNVANFSLAAKIEAESAAQLGTGVSTLTDSNFSGSAPQGLRWTPPGLSEQMLCRLVVAGLTDLYGRYRVFVRCRDNAASTANIKIRVRSGGAVPGTFLTGGDYADVQKFAGVFTGATTVLPLVDCGVVSWPFADAVGQAVFQCTLEINGQALSTSSTFDLDCVYLVPCYEGGDESGYFAATFPVVLGTGTQPDGVLDSNDRVPDAYMVDGSGNLNGVAQDLRGKPILVWPSRSQVLMVLALDSTSATGALFNGHNWNVNNTITLSYTPRYRWVRGS